MAPLSVFGDFDQDGRISRKPAEQDLRNTFPGLILLPNIDADRRRLPRNVAPGKAVPLDRDSARSAADNEGALITVQVSDSNARSLRLTVSDGAEIFVAVTDRHRKAVRLKGNAFQTSVRGAGSYDFRLEATRLRGSPLSGVASLGSVFSITVAALDASGAVLEEDEIVATLAPWIIKDNLRTPERLYICEIAERERLDRGNHPSVKEVGDIVRPLKGVDFVTIPDAVCNGDAWIQDQFQLGFCASPNQHLDVIVHLPRLRQNISSSSLSANLNEMIDSHFPSKDLGVFRDFYDRTLGQASTPGGGTRTIRFRESYELSRQMERVWTVWGLVGKVYFKGDMEGVLRLQSIEEDLAKRHFMRYFEARSLLPSLVGRMRRLLDRRAAREVSDEKKAVLEKQRDMLKEYFSVVGKTIILKPGEKKIHVPTKALGELIFSETQIDKLDENLAGKHDSLNFGGNLEVSPPLPDAPLGKIAFGANLGHAFRAADPDLVNFLQAQVAQPMVDIETAWLEVAHVDEVMAFLPAPSTGAKAAIAVASPRLGMAIIDAAFAAYMEGGGTSVSTIIRDENALDPLLRDRMDDGDAPITQMLRGRYWLHRVPKDALSTIGPPQIYLDMAQYYPADFQEAMSTIRLDYTPGQDKFYNASMTVRELRYFGRFTNDWLAENTFRDLGKHLSREFRSLDQIEIPVLYDEVVWRKDPDTKEFKPDFDNDPTSAFLPNGVNMQVLGDHVLVPRPYGPRATPEVAQKILGRAAPDLADLFSAEAMRRLGLDRTIHWVKRPIFPGASGSDLDRIARQFADGFPDLEEEEIQAVILDANGHAFEGENPADGLPDLKEGWQRVVIPEGRVDLFEGFIALRLAALGLKMHFVDSWYYHIRAGEIHCGTNVLRRKDPRAPAWWTAASI